MFESRLSPAEAADRVSFIQFEDTRILHLDVSGLADVSEAVYLLEICQQIIFNEPLESVRLLSNVTNAPYSKEVFSIIQEFSKSITPYIKASAMVGVGNGIIRMLLNGLLVLSGREILAMDSLETAKKYLVSK